MRVAYWDCPWSSSSSVLFLMGSSSTPCMISCHLPVSSHSSPGCWSMVMLENSVHDFWSCISAPLCIIRAPLWEGLDLNSSSVFRLLSYSSVCQTCSAETSLPPVHSRLVADQWPVTALDAFDHCCCWLLWWVTQTCLQLGQECPSQVHFYSCCMIRLFWNYIMSLW